MEAIYTQINNYLIDAGQRLVPLQGNISDIGVIKKNVTEEDYRIERELSDIILGSNPSHKIYAEEEHDVFEAARDVWIIDPISGTRALIEGRLHYASVVSHICNGVAQYAGVYDPAVNELFTAQLGQGATLNGQPISVSNGITTMLENTATSQYDSHAAVQLRQATKHLNPVRNEASFAVNYCWVASGRFDGIVSVAKDAFPEFAGALILSEAGGLLTNIDGGQVQPDDRLFVGGNPAMYASLLHLSQAVFQQPG